MPVVGYPEVAEVRKNPEDKFNIGEGWHSDLSFDQAPAMDSILYAKIAPASSGDTLFANMYAAYDALPSKLKRQLLNMQAHHSSRHTFGDRQAIPSELRRKFRNLDEANQDALHPVVIRHPLSGRPALYVNPDFTLRFAGMTVDESRPLLDFLYEHAVKDEFVQPFSWQQGSIAF